MGVAWRTGSVSCRVVSYPAADAAGAWVLREHFLKERPIKELAAEKGVDEHRVRNLETRALRAMRRLMSGGDADGEPAP